MGTIGRFYGAISVSGNRDSVYYGREVRPDNGNIGNIKRGRILSTFKVSAPATEAVSESRNCFKSNICPSVKLIISGVRFKSLVV